MLLKQSCVLALMKNHSAWGACEQVLGSNFKLWGQKSKRAYSFIDFIYIACINMTSTTKYALNFAYGC